MTNEETEQQPIPKEFLNPDSDPVYTNDVEEFRNRFDSVLEEKKKGFDSARKEQKESFEKELEKDKTKREEMNASVIPKENVLEISHRAVAQRIAKQLDSEGAMVITFKGDTIKFGVENLSPAQIQEAMCLGIHYNRKYIEQNGHPDFSKPDTEPKKVS